MLQLKAKSLFYFSLACCGLVLVILFFSCQKKAEPTTVQEQPLTTLHPVFHKGVGGPLDSATSNRYKRNLAQRLRQHKWTGVTTTVFYLPAADLEKLIQREQTAGICFYFGQDNSGLVHLMPIGVDVYGAVMPTTAVTTNNTTIDWQTAKQWSHAFKTQHAGGIWAHFWGEVAVRRLLEQGTELVRIELGLDDDGSQKMIFSNAALVGDDADMTSTCPPHCPLGFDVAN